MMPTGMSLRGTRILGLGLDSILASSSRPFGATEIILPGETKTAPLVEFGGATVAKLEPEEELEKGTPDGDDEVKDEVDNLGLTGTGN
jgi:hypothetical protein